MRLSTVGRIILAEVCIIFNNCSVTESNDSLTLAKKRKLGGLRSYFEGGEKWKNISMDFFFLSKLHVALSRFGLKYLVQLHKMGTTFVLCLRPNLYYVVRRWYSLRGFNRKVDG